MTSPRTLRAGGAILMLLVSLSPLLPGQRADEGEGGGLRFEIRFGPEQSSDALDGRVLLMLSTDDSKECIECHAATSPGIVWQWRSSTHAEANVGCVECHEAGEEDPDGFAHYGVHIATVVTPRDCASCHDDEAEEFAASHHAAAGNILASLDNYLAATVEHGAAEKNVTAPSWTRDHTGPGWERQVRSSPRGCPTDEETQAAQAAQVATRPQAIRWPDR